MFNLTAGQNDLKAGYSLITREGKELKIDSLHSFNTDTATAVYNIETEKNHNYYVSRSSVLTHNCNEGVYIYNTTKGTYIGQTNNFIRRLTEHLSPTGTLGSINATIESEIRNLMPGATKLEREVYEQYLINRYSIENLINIRNPMGGRMDIYKAMIDDVINKYTLPR